MGEGGKEYQMENADCCLVIHTNAYTGNFERELIAYSFGILDEVQEDIDYACEYKKIFWNNVIGMHVNSKEEYENDEVAGLMKSFLWNEKKKNEEVLQLYEYLRYTSQQVDDWSQDTFYNICSFYKNEQYDCDTILVQLEKPLSGNLETLVIERIKNFFRFHVLDIVEDYTWLCQFGEPRDRGKEQPVILLDLELIDSDNNLIKKYV